MKKKMKKKSWLWCLCSRILRFFKIYFVYVKKKKLYWTFSGSITDLKTEEKEKGMAVTPSRGIYICSHLFAAQKIRAFFILFIWTFVELKMVKPSRDEHWTLHTGHFEYPPNIQRCLVVIWLVPHETAAVSAQVVCTPHNHARVYSVTLFEATCVGCMRV